MPTSNKIVLASLAVVLSVCVGACTTEVPPSELAQMHARATENRPMWPSAPASPLVTNLDSMRAALPDFALRDASDREVSVERMLAFDHNSPILSSSEIKRLALLQTYLRHNPTTTVRIEGYLGPANSGERSSLALDRAQAIARALLTDMRIQNGISAVAAPQTSSGASQAAIILITEQSLGSLGLPEAR
jgi:outer membrane protein OmpA-like peptidoglycan-associated protein